MHAMHLSRSALTRMNTAVQQLVRPDADVAVGAEHATYCHKLAMVSMPARPPEPVMLCRYKPNTHDIVKDAGERAYWLGVLRDAVPVSVDKASLSEERSPGTCLIPATCDDGQLASAVYWALLAHHAHHAAAAVLIFGVLSCSY